jgi:hypothetical protein
MLDQELEIIKTVQVGGPQKEKHEDHNCFSFVHLPQELRNMNHEIILGAEVRYVRSVGHDIGNLHSLCCNKQWKMQQSPLAESCERIQYYSFWS